MPAYFPAASSLEVVHEVVLGDTVKWQSSVPAEVNVTVPWAPAGSLDSARVAAEP